MPEGQTEEECGQKPNDFASLPGFFRSSDFAVPLPTSLRSATFSPGEGLAPAAHQEAKR
jgi:hypothetical protein